ncbi:MAG: response regulator [Candidatus Wallbacteria bacterium]|nr:response regulator [Candidatus Wallbacteria bacterium]
MMELSEELSSVAIVDDEVDFGRSTQEYFARFLGWATSYFECPSHLVAELTVKNSTPDVIVLDLTYDRGPGARGVQMQAAYELISKAAPDTPIVVLTGVAKDSRTAMELIGAGAREFVTKPVEARDLARNVMLAFTRKRREEHSERQRANALNAAHMFKNVAFMIHGYCELLETLEEEEAADRAKYVGIIRKQARRALRFYDGLKRINSVPKDIGIELASAREVIQDLFFTIREMPLSAQVREKLQLNYSLPDTGLKIPWNSLMEEVLHNLLKNAAEAMAPDREKLAIVVQARLADKEIVLSVEDTAGGIPPEDQVRLFQPFHSRKESGSGVGLYASKMIVETVFNGQLEFKSDLSRGTTEFTVRYPNQTRPGKEVSR